MNHARCTSVGEDRGRSVAVAVLMIGSALGFTLMTGPFTHLLGAGAGAVPAAVHGLTAFLYLFVGTIGLYLGLATHADRSTSAPSRICSCWRSSWQRCPLLAIVFGNWLYICITGPRTRSPRSYFLA